MACNSRVGTLAVTSGPRVHSFVDGLWNQKDAEAGGGGPGAGERLLYASVGWVFHGIPISRFQIHKNLRTPTPPPPPPLPTSSP